MLHKYGMRLRGASPGAQPKDFKRFDESDSRYWNVLYYDRILTDEETYHYSLDYLGSTEGEGDENDEG